MTTIITIRERDGQATLVFDHGVEFPITVHDPFTPEQEELLEWYFEQRLRFPFTGQVRAQQAAASVRAYGEGLFKQVFADPRAYARYHAALQAGVEHLAFEIAGSHDFHALHWEALWDPDLPEPFVLYAPMVRRNLVPQPVQARFRPSPTINLLLVTARPAGAGDVGYRTISRPLVESLRQAGTPARVEIVRPGTYAALLDHLQAVRDAHGTGYYHVIHFDVHGALLTYSQYKEGAQSQRYLYNARYGRDDIQEYQGRRAFLFLESAKEGQSDPLEAGELADLLTTHQIPIVVLNACQSGKQVHREPGRTVGEAETSLGSRLMRAGVQMTLAMGYSVTVTAAKLLMETLYQRLFEGGDLPAAIRRARLELYNRKGRRVYFDQMVDLEDWLLPVVYQNQEQRLQTRDFTPDELAAHYERQARRYRPPDTPYGFVGRDLDILNVERRLLARRNALLIRGLGGAGKTTLLHHLAAWWQATGFVERAWYFGYDQSAWTRQQIMHDVARDLLSAGEHAAFLPLSPAAQQELLAGRLRAGRYLLVLDNAESITGEHLAIQNTLPPAERQLMHDLARALSGGRALLLVGSRGGAEWLAPGVFEDNVYDLPGLDPEAASALAERVLQRHGAMRYRDDADLAQLLKLLAGYPLPIEVVLANLARQTPAQVLAALQAGDEAIDMRSENKTESILRCIDYSHANLSPGAQQLLACLAPFTGVLYQPAWEQYTARLRQQPALADLPFESWEGVLQQAANWGLLKPHDQGGGYLRLQPTLPYFLRSRLAAPEQAEVKHAIETAFRQLYDQWGRQIAGLLRSREAQERQTGQALARLEYENLVTALNLALEAQVSILNPYNALSSYLDATQDQRRGLELGETVLARLEAYPTETLTGQLSAEFVAILDDIAKRQLLLQRHAAAEASYQKALSIWLDNKSYDADQIREMSASIYHQLGYVAQEQRQWAQAQDYYQRALEIFIAFNDRHSQALIYHNLGAVAQEQRQRAQAQDYYQRALEIKIAFNDRYSQASTYHNLGVVAQEQRQWEQAQDYYQRALEIFIAFNDRHGQARLYHGFGRVAEEQRQWAQARDYYLRALETFEAYQDAHNRGITLRSLARLWQSSGDETLPAAVAAALSITPQEAQDLLSAET